MIADDEKDALAAEYVLGTLDADERSEALALIAADEDFATQVGSWERRLGELNILVASVEPAPELWEKIKLQIASASQGGDLKLPGEDMPEGVEAAPPESAAAPAGEAPAPATPTFSTPAGGRRSLAAILFAAIAVSLALVAAGQVLRPDLMPARLRPKPIIERVEVVKTVEVPSPRPAQFVSVLQKDPFSPAFILTFDSDRKTLSVRALGAEPQAGKNYELWLVSDKLQAPRSLGLIGAQEFTVRPAPADFDSTTINGATYTVTIEPQGGSKTGAPTGSTVYSGKLTQTTPPGFPARIP